MVDCLVRDLHLSVQPRWLAGVLVAIKAGKVAARHFQADAMAGLKEIAGFPEDKLIGVDHARFD